MFSSSWDLKAGGHWIRKKFSFRALGSLLRKCQRCAAGIRQRVHRQGGVEKCDCQMNELLPGAQCAPDSPDPNYPPAPPLLSVVLAMPITASVGKCAEMEGLVYCTKLPARLPEPTDRPLQSPLS